MLNIIYCRFEVEIKDVPDPLPVEGKKIQPQPKATEPLRILCGSFSRTGSYLALCDDHKQMTVWNTQDWSLVKQWNLVRRANKVVFDKEDQILIAGKKLLILK